MRCLRRVRQAGKPIRLADDNANILQYQITRRTTEELGLSPILGSIYDGFIGGLGGDGDFAGAMANFTDQAKFEAALAEITAQRGVLYDERAVDACLKIFAERKVPLL